MTRAVLSRNNHRRILAFILLAIANASVVYLVMTRTEKATIRRKIQFATHWGQNTWQHQNEMTDISIIRKLQRRDDLWKEITQYNELNVKNEKRRLPKVIGIGVKKCGTGGIIHFLNHHPLVKIPRTRETKFFHSRKLNYTKYRMKMPFTNDRQVAMEKSPSYFNAAPEEVPDRIKSGIPDVKLILIVCDPTPRAFSDYVHERNNFFTNHVKMVAKYKTFENYVDAYLPKVQMKIEEWKTENSSLDDEPANGQRKNIIKLKQTDSASTILTHGLYTAHIGRWKSVFNESNLKIIEGKQFMEDPGAIMEDLQDFIRLPKLLLREDFVKRPDTGFYCYRRFTEEHLRNQTNPTNHEYIQCLNRGKGLTRNNQKTIPSAAFQKLSYFYRPFNERFYREVGEDFDWL